LAAKFDATALWSPGRLEADLVGRAFAFARMAFWSPI
jgi:hypothetical protein